MNQQWTLKQESGRHITAEEFDCHVVYNIVSYDKETPLGRALLLALPDGALLLLDIYVYEEKNRRKGVANEMMNYITNTFPDVITSYITKAGRELCLKHGFQWHRPTFSRGIEILRFQKSEGLDGKKRKG